MNTFTQESLLVFYNDTQKNFIELKSQSETIKKLETQLNILTLQKALESEKNENLLYKLSVMNDKILASEQKVNELNSIMMKYFAYKSENKQIVQPPTQIGQPGFTFNNK